MLRAPVAEEGEREPGELALVLADRQQVGEQLARVEVVAQRVDDGHRACRPPSLRAPPARRCARRSRRPGARARAPCRTGVSLPPSWLFAVEMISGTAAEVGDADRERDARAGGRLVEDHRDGLRAGERLELPAVLLQLDGEVEDLGLLGRRSGRRRAANGGSCGHLRGSSRLEHEGVLDGAQRRGEQLDELGDLGVADDERRREPDASRRSAR